MAMVGNFLTDVINKTSTTFLGKFDVLDIPTNMVNLETVVMPIAWTIFLVFCVFEVLGEQTKAIKEKNYEAAYRRIITDIVLITMGLVVYKGLFIKIVAFCEAIGISFVSIKDILNFYATLIGIANDTKLPPLLLTNPADFLYGISTVFFILISVIMQELLLIIRYVLLSILYVFGPLAFAMSIFKGLRHLLSGWFTNVFQISFWIIIFKIIQFIFINFYKAHKSVGMLGQFEGLIIGLLFMVLLICVPIISTKLLSGQTLGLVGTVIMKTAQTQIGRLVTLVGAGAVAKKAMQSFSQNPMGNLGNKNQNTKAGSASKNVIPTSNSAKNRTKTKEERTR